MDQEGLGYTLWQHTTNRMTTIACHFPSCRLSCTNKPTHRLATTFLVAMFPSQQSCSTHKNNVEMRERFASNGLHSTQYKNAQKIQPPWENGDEIGPKLETSKKSANCTIWKATDVRVCVISCCVCRHITHARFVIHKSTLVPSLAACWQIGAPHVHLARKLGHVTV